jgi:hypothetical protein
MKRVRNSETVMYMAKCTALYATTGGAGKSDSKYVLEER